MSRVIDDFTGTDNALPSTELWTVLAGTPIISGNKLRSDYGDAVESTFTLSGDFDVYIDYNNVSGPATNSWEFSFGVKIDASNKYYIGFVYDGGWKFFLEKVAGGTYSNPTQVTANYQSGKLRVTRVTNTLTCYYHNGSTWVSLSGAWDYGSAPAVKVLTGYSRWGSNPTFVCDMDNLTLDAGSVNWQIATSDSFASSEGIVPQGAYSINLAETVAAGDDPHWYNELYVKTIDDALVALDVAGRILGFSHLDGLTITDLSKIGATGKLASDSLAITDSQIANVCKVVADYLLINQTINTNWKGTRTLTETIQGLDTVTGAKAYLHSLAETVAIPDSIIRALGFVTSDRVAVADTVTNTGKLNHTLAEQFLLMTTLVGGRGFRDTLAETLTATDALALLVHRMCVAADTLAAADTVTPLRTAPITNRDSITIAETLTPAGKFSHILTDTVSFCMTITLGGEVYQCWSFSPDDMYASLYTNYGFNSYASLNGHDYGCKDGVIYILEGADDAGTVIERGVRVNYASMGTHLRKRLFHAFFGLVGEEPVLKVITDSGEDEYYVVGQKAHIAKGLNGVNWELILTQIDSLDFIEVSPVILSR